MMVLSLLATGVALFLALRAQTERNAEQSETAVPRGEPNLP
jgi:hypothetical protein